MPCKVLPINHLILSVAESLDISVQQNVSSCVYRRLSCWASCWIGCCHIISSASPTGFKTKGIKASSCYSTEHSLRFALGQTMILHKKLDSECYVKLKLFHWRFWFGLVWFVCLFACRFCLLVCLPVFFWGLQLTRSGTQVFVQESENTVKKAYSVIMQHSYISKDHIVYLILWTLDM